MTALEPLCSATTVHDGERVICDNRAGHASSLHPTPHWDTFAGVTW